MVEALGLTRDGFDMAEYIKAYSGGSGGAAAPLPPTRQQQTQKSMAVPVVQERQFVPPRDPNGDAPAIVPIVIKQF
jgi:hypothetical protein